MSLSVCLSLEEVTKMCLSVYHLRRSLRCVCLSACLSLKEVTKMCLFVCLSLKEVTKICLSVCRLRR